MDQTQPQKQRLLFLDNLRYVIVLYVLFFHVAAGYSGWPEYFQETQAGGFFRIVRGIIHFIPRMPLLFFVAGFEYRNMLTFEAYFAEYLFPFILAVPPKLFCAW